MLRVMRAVDKATGYTFGKEEERTLNGLMSCAMAAEFESEKIGLIQEKYIDRSGAVDKQEESMTLDKLDMLD